MGDISSPSIGAQNCTLSYTNEWSSNGEHSLRIFSNSNKIFYFGLQSINLGFHEELINKTIQFIADFNTNIPLYLRIYYNIGGNWSSQGVLVNSPTNNVSVTLNVPSNCINVWFRIDSTKGYDNTTCYTDNWRLKIIQ